MAIIDDIDRFLPWAEERTRGSWVAHDETTTTWTSFRPKSCDGGDDCRSGIRANSTAAMSTRSTLCCWSALMSPAVRKRPIEVGGRGSSAASSFPTASKDWHDRSTEEDYRRQGCRYSRAMMKSILSSNRTWTFDGAGSSFSVHVHVERLFKIRFIRQSNSKRINRLVFIVYHLCSCQLRRICGDGKRGIGYDESCRLNKRLRSWPCRRTDDSGEWNAIAKITQISPQ